MNTLARYSTVVTTIAAAVDLQEEANRCYGWRFVHSDEIHWKDGMKLNEIKRRRRIRMAIHHVLVEPSLALEFPRAPLNRK